MELTTGCRKPLYMAMELSANKWGLAFSDEVKIRAVTVGAGKQEDMLLQVKRAKEKMGYAADAPVISCYEAGRDGFWIHRFLEQHGIQNRVVDAASIEVNRRKRQIKTDRLDAEKLVRMLIRYEKGEKTLWKVARVPGEAEEDERRMHRELQRLKQERTAHSNRIGSLLCLLGIRVPGRSRKQVPVDKCLQWNGKGLPESLRDELRREQARMGLVDEQIKGLEKTQEARIKKPKTQGDSIAFKLIQLKGVGVVGAWTLSKEFFGWRMFRNRREVGAASGLVGTPYSSGTSSHDQGISKAGNVRIRWVMIELAWRWVQFQPQSALSKWFWKRFGFGTSRMRRIGIVALARKLLIVFWKYLTQGENPEGAVFKAA